MENNHLSGHLGGSVGEACNSWFGLKSWSCSLWEIKPLLRLCAGSLEPPWDSRSPSLSPCICICEIVATSGSGKHCWIQRKLMCLQVQFRGTWVAQSVKLLTLAQVMILRFMSSSPTSGSVLTAWILEPVSDSVSPSLSLPLMGSCSVSLSPSKINIKKEKKKKQVQFRKESE